MTSSTPSSAYCATHSRICPGDEGEGDQRFGVVVDEPVEETKGGEGAGISAPGPVEQGRGVADGQAETDVHEVPP
jgi:hypothetical protein